MNISLRWHELANLYHGHEAIVFGNGPSLDSWLAEDHDLKDKLLIGVNRAYLVVPVKYTVSNDAGMFWWADRDTSCEWVLGTPSGGGKNGYSDWYLPKNTNYWFQHLHHLDLLKQTREEISDSRRLYNAITSSNPAVHFAWYLGARSVQLVGMDGKRGHCEAMTKIIQKRNPAKVVTRAYWDQYEELYNSFRKSVEQECEILWPGNWSHYTPKCK